MNLLQKALMIIKAPVQFFKRGDNDVGKAFMYLAVFYLAFIIMTTIVSFFTQAASVAFVESLGIKVPHDPSVFARIIGAVFGFAFALIFSFFFAAILHVYLRIFGGKASYSQTYAMSVYSGTPTMLVGWIPIVSFFAGFWSLVLLIIGISEVHKMSRLKATLLILIPLSILVIVGIVIAMMAAFLVVSTMSGAYA